MSTISMIAIVLGALYIVFNLFTFMAGKETWAPYIYEEFRKDLTPFGAFVPTVLIVCLTLIYQIICTIGMFFAGIGTLWMTIFARKDIDEEI